MGKSGVHFDDEFMPTIVGLSVTSDVRIHDVAVLWSPDGAEPSIPGFQRLCECQGIVFRNLIHHEIDRAGRKTIQHEAQRFDETVELGSFVRQGDHKRPIVPVVHLAREGAKFVAIVHLCSPDLGESFGMQPVHNRRFPNGVDLEVQEAEPPDFGQVGPFAAAHE
jgi:hypothetical protein